MIKRKLSILLVAIILFFINPLAAQDLTIIKADRYFGLFQFDKAIEQYQLELQKNPKKLGALTKLADCYRLRGNTVEAEHWYSEVVKDSSANAICYFYLAQALRSNAKYDEAKEAYHKYAERVENDRRGRLLDTSFDEIAELKKDSTKYVVQLVPNINTDFSDFSPAFYKDSSLVFPSARDHKKIDVWTGQPFLDLFMSEKVDTGFKAPVALNGDVNRKYHQGPATFAGDSVMYFTRNNYKKRTMNKDKDDDIMKMIIVKSTLKNSQWEDLDFLPFNSTEYSVQYPSLTADGKRMYFSSDMPGGYGGFDLYYIEKQADGAWGKPQNLGDGVNTKGDEGFPFIANDSMLYFASDSYVGFGGLDNYYATATNGKFGGVTNMGYPINTNFDDFGLIINKTREGGYFSSNRQNGVGSDDIYSFSKRKYQLKGLVYDRTSGEPIENAKVSLLLGKDTLSGKQTNVKGEFVFAVYKDKDYSLPASKEGYSDNAEHAFTKLQSDTLPIVRIPLDKHMIRLLGTTFEIKVNETTNVESRIGKLPSVAVKLMDLTSGKVDSSISDANGGFAFLINPNHNYKVIGDKTYYFLKREVKFDTKGKTDGELTVELDLSKLEGIIRLANIYYDFDKYNIRKDAAKELDRLFEILLKYPDMEIEMRSHTDCRASINYNKRLSTNRAMSAVYYLVEKGRKQHQDLSARITAFGYGELAPVFMGLCSSEQGDHDDKISAEEAKKHQLNRRTEFYVTKQPSKIHVESSVSER